MVYIQSETASITVVIPLKNYHDCLEFSLRSLTTSTLAPAEVVLVDDGSNDAVSIWYADQLRRLRPDIQIKLLRTEGFGAGAARQAGVEAATQRWIAFLDSEDLWPPDYLEHRVRLLPRRA